MCSDKKLTQDDKPHSADYLVAESRDFWWNLDFIQLMAKRLELVNVKSVLDVGCGVGHWSRVLASVLPDDTQINGIDLEEAWIKEATNFASTHGLDARCHYQIGNALSIPFPDNTFDMVTCQTLLIHLKNPSEALKEFIRVLKPNGVLLIAESSSVPLMFWANNVGCDLDLDSFVKIIKFQRACELGKYTLHEGWISEGEFIAGYLAKLPVHDIQVFLSDKCNPLFPPYNQTKEQEIIAKSIIEDVHDKADMWIWDIKTTKKYFNAGMLKENPDLSQAYIDQEFDDNWALVKKVDAAIVNKVRQNKFSTSGAAVMYLTTAKKT